MCICVLHIQKLDSWSIVGRKYAWKYIQEKKILEYKKTNLWNNGQGYVSVTGYISQSVGQG